MTRYLVAYYSWTGATAKVAKAIAAELSADLEEIREVRKRSGFLAFIRSAIEANRRATPEIAPAVRNAGDYDAVILGFPVWAGEMASPMRSYIEREKAKFGRIAAFCTLRGSGGETALQSVAASCGRPPVAMLMLTTAQLASAEWRERVRAFTRAASAQPAAPA